MSTVKPEGVEVVGLAVGSEGATSRAIAEEAGFRYIEHPNRPLGRKWNAVSREAQKYDPDALMVLGSDDVVNTKYVEGAMEVIRNGADYTCITNGYMYDWTTGYLIFLKANVVIGSGRVFSRRLCDMLDWELWSDDREQTMDADTDLRIRQRFPESDGFVFEPCLVGDILIVKEQSTDDGDGENIWSFQHVARRTVWLPAKFEDVDQSFPGLFAHDGMSWLDSD